MEKAERVLLKKLEPASFAPDLPIESDELSARRRYDRLLSSIFHPNSRLPCRDHRNRLSPTSFWKLLGLAGGRKGIFTEGL